MLTQKEVANVQAIESRNLIDDARTPKARNEIAIKGLVRKFGDITAVNNLNLEIRKGEMFGFLGPNGAGKTTTISMLCGLLKPTAGSAQIAGYDIAKEPQKVKAHIGVCPQEAAVFKFLTGMENLELFGNLHGMDTQAAKRTGCGISQPGRLLQRLLGARPKGTAVA